MLVNSDDSSDESTDLDDTVKTNIRKNGTKKKNEDNATNKNTSTTGTKIKSIIDFYDGTSINSTAKDELNKSIIASARSSDATVNLNSITQDWLFPTEERGSDVNPNDYKLPESAEDAPWFSLAFFTMKPTVANAGLLILMAGAAMLVYGLVIASTPLSAAGALTAGTGTLLAMYGHYSKPRVDVHLLDDSDLSFSSNIATNS